MTLRSSEATCTGELYSLTVYLFNILQRRSKHGDTVLLYVSSTSLPNVHRFKTCFYWQPKSKCMCSIAVIKDLLNIVATLHTKMFNYSFIHSFIHSFSQSFFFFFFYCMLSLRSQVKESSFAEWSAHSSDSSTHPPIHQGVFSARRLECQVSQSPGNLLTLSYFFLLYPLHNVIGPCPAESASSFHHIKLPTRISRSLRLLKPLITCPAYSMPVSVWHYFFL